MRNRGRAGGVGSLSFKGGILQLSIAGDIDPGSRQAQANVPQMFS